MLYLACQSSWRCKNEGADCWWRPNFFLLLNKKVSTKAELIMFVKKDISNDGANKENIYRNLVLFLQSVITSEWLLWVLWSSFLFKDSFSWACPKGHLDYFHDWGKSLPCWIDAATNLLCITADFLMFKFLEGWCKNPIGGRPFLKYYKPPPFYMKYLPKLGRYPQ